ncbi:unnamed protein product [Lathyrus sativus]|nr:unnamed protein product [Lathyrus sativus]
MSWDNLCKPKAEGGLDIINLESFNKALLMKWKWRIVTDREAIWRCVLRHSYTNPEAKMFINDSSAINHNDSIWCKWVGNQTMKKAFPESYASLVNHLCTVAEAGQWINGSWNWSLCNIGLTGSNEASYVTEFLMVWEEDNSVEHDMVDTFEWWPEKFFFFFCPFCVPQALSQEDSKFNLE